MTNHTCQIPPFGARILNSHAPVDGIITPTAFDPTDNDALRSDTRLTAWAQNGMLHVSGVTVGELWSIYNLSGVLVYRNLATDHEATICLPDRGIYIIKSGNQTMKIVH